MNADVLAALDGLTVGQALRRSTRLYPDNFFFKSEDRRATFAEMDEAVDRFACGLIDLGISRGDHVALWLPNGYAWALAFLACARVGAVVVPINTRYTAPEAGYILRQSDARMLVLSRRLWDRDFGALLVEIAPDLEGAGSGPLRLDSLPTLEHLVWVDEAEPSTGIGFDRLGSSPIDQDRLTAAESAVKPRDPLLICYTSGSTGRPKGAMHDHRVIRQATRVGLSLRLEPGGSILGHMPLYHVAGLFMALVPAMTLGGAFVSMKQWDPQVALELMERERLTCFGGIPTHYVDLVNDASLPERDLSRLKVAWIGGSPVMQATYNRYREALGLDHLLSTYGMTENTISTTFNRFDDPVDACAGNRAPILGEGEVRVVDPDSGRVLPAGEVGEVWCRGETVMMGYYRDPEATRIAITDEGWLRTGDLGRFDQDGFLTITGRLREMYKSGGTNVYPTEVEQHLSRHPAVRMAAVVGVPDERLGEVGIAFVELNPGQAFDESSMREHCRNVLAGYKVPRYLAIVAELPRTSTGKIQRSGLLALARGFMPKR